MVETKDFSSFPGRDYKKRTVEHWGSDPCGSGYSSEQFKSRAFFEEVEAHRYHSHPWILEAINGFDIAGREVLEIGYGMGTDHLSLARRGAVMHGVDLTPENLEVTQARFDLYGFRSDLRVGDGESLPFEDGTFDFVYSFGVVHHTPDTAKAVEEIARVLKPGGRCYVTVYHRNSIFFWWTVYLFNYLLRGGRKVRTLEQQLSLVEYPNCSEEMVIRLYRRREFAALFRAFGSTTCSVTHLIPADMALVSRLFRDQFRPHPLLGLLGRRWGWYLVAESVK